MAQSRVLRRAAGTCRTSTIRCGISKEVRDLGQESPTPIPNPSALSREHPGVRNLQLLAPYPGRCLLLEVSCGVAVLHVDAGRIVKGTEVLVGLPELGSPGTEGETHVRPAVFPQAPSLSLCCEGDSQSPGHSGHLDRCPGFGIPPQLCPGLTGTWPFP